MCIKKHSDQITFKTSTKCPSSFDSWTFFWSFPEIDKDAELEYLVLKPNGKKYSHWKTKEHIDKNPEKGTEFRSDFGVDFEGGNPKCFYNKKLEFTFLVNKGRIKFSQKNVEHFKFQFHKTIKTSNR